VSPRPRQVPYAWAINLLGPALIVSGLFRKSAEPNAQHTCLGEALEAAAALKYGLKP
jgi:hypothetical protein